MQSTAEVQKICPVHPFQHCEGEAHNNGGLVRLSFDMWADNKERFSSSGHLVLMSLPVLFLEHVFHVSLCDCLEVA